VAAYGKDVLFSEIKEYIVAAFLKLKMFKNLVKHAANVSERSREL